MDTWFCLDALEDAVRMGAAKIRNADQDEQFANAALQTGWKPPACGAAWTGRGCWPDNVFVERLWRSVKYEKVHLRPTPMVSRRALALARSPSRVTANLLAVSRRTTMFSGRAQCVAVNSSFRRAP